MVHIVYITTNLVNGKQYVGDHSSDNLKDGYLGSGTAIKRAIKKFGKKNFNREILESFDTKEEAFKAQEKYILKFQTLSPIGYNISPKGGMRNNGSHSEKTIQQISKTQKNMPMQRRRQMSKSHTGLRHSEETKEKQSKSHKGEKNPMFGKPAWDAINKITKTCEYCGIETNVGNYGRWHGKKCKHKS